MISAKNSVLDYYIPSRITNRGTYHPSTEERFWSYVDKDAPSGCWEWKGKLEKKGYGRFKATSKSLKAHRCAYEFLHGRIPEGMLVCHTCDNRSCVNPYHLFLGTDSDNMQDMTRKGRNKNPSSWMVGNKNPTSKLTEKEVKDIRDLYSRGGYTYFDLAKIYKVSYQLIGAIVLRKVRNRTSV